MTGKDRFIPAILAAMAVAIAPHALRLPPWIVVWCGTIWSYVFYAAKTRQAMPGPALRLALTIGGFIAGLVTYGFSFHMDAGVGLLCIMVGLKPLETRTHRDRMMTVFLTYFLVITTLFFTNELLMTIYMGCSVWVTTAVLIRINHPAGPVSGAFRLSLAMMVQAIPLMVLLFLFFPRIQGSLWGAPKQNIGVTGFSERLEPGNVAALVRSDAIAFRAEFDGRIPPKHRLYWRGLVFQHFDGTRWFQDAIVPAYMTFISGSDPVQTRITLEPHGKKWLFALDLPYRTSWPVRLLADHTIMSHRAFHARIRYSVASYMKYHTGALQPWENASLALPDRGNPLARALAEKWSAEAIDPVALIETALAYFRENEFYYTLNAPMLDRDSIDDFVFRTRKGYCEHYASAFVFLMRAAGLPSRIVGGYLGGEINPYGNYLIVRQSDAHTWAEVWLSGKGWVRVDPTAAVAPDRVAQGAAAALAPQERLIFERFNRLDLGPLTPYWNQFALGWDVVNSRWNGWVLGYSHFQQQAIFSKFGMGRGSLIVPMAATIGVTAVAGLSVFGFFVWTRRKTSGKKDTVQDAYVTFCDKLARVGSPKPASQGPVHYARDVASSRPDLSAAVRRITDQYVRIRYADAGDQETVKAFVADVRRFHPKKPRGTVPNR